MIERVGRVIILVHDQEEALRFYADKLGFETIADLRLADGFRALHLGPRGQSGTGVWLMPTTTDEQRARVGNQTGGLPCMVLYTDDCYQSYLDLMERGVVFHGTPIEGPEGIHIHFEDLYGNDIILVQLTGG